MASSSLRLLYEDESIIAVDKEAGHLVHAADNPQPGDIVTMKLVRDYTGLKIYPTHRLDRPTCGVLLFAKNKTAARAINRAFERKQVEKSYRALISGKPKLATWTCSEPLQKSEELPFREAVTDFQVLAQISQEFTLLEARPRTGRYHQIRKHLLRHGHPIIGDYRYAGFEACEEWDKRFQLDKRMLLQCQRLQLHHPTSRTPITIEAPADPHFTRIQ